MGGQFNPLSRLLADSKPAVWLPPSDFVSQQRITPRVSGVAAFLSELNTANETRPPVTKSRLQLQNEERQARESQRIADFGRQRSQWDPERDANIHGDPHSTIIVARMRYSVSDEELTSEFGKYGRIEHRRIIPNRGYAFVVYDNPRAARTALQNTANGITLQGRRVITDLEKGRTQKDWLPRRLGGGLGGRFSLARQKAEIHRAQYIQRSFRAQKRDVRGVSRPNDGPGKRDGRDFARRDMRRPPPSYDPRRSSASTSYTNDRPLASRGGAPESSSQPATHEPAGRALRRY